MSDSLPSTAPAAKAPPTFTFGLGSLMLIVTTIAVCLGAFSIAPGLGILLAILATPALIRTMGIVRRRSLRGRRADVEFKIGAFLTSMFVVAAIGVAAGGTFFATCFVGFMGGMAGSEAFGVGGYDSLGFGFLVGVSLGIVAGLVVAVFVIRRLWPARNS